MVSRRIRQIKLQGQNPDDPLKVVVRRFLTPRIRNAVFVVTAMFILSAATVGAADYVVIKVRHRPADELGGRGESDPFARRNGDSR